MNWSCPKCKRTFRRANQEHVCTKSFKANTAALLKNRPPEIVALYRKLEATVKGFGRVEVVIGDHYVLFRTTRIFTDLTVMNDALRVVIHIGRKVPGKLWLKVGGVANAYRTSHWSVLPRNCARSCRFCARRMNLRGAKSANTQRFFWVSQ